MEKTYHSNAGFLRLKSVLQLIPVSRSSWYQGIREGRYPKAVKLSPRTSGWRKSDIIRLIGELNGQD